MKRVPVRYAGIVRGRDGQPVRQVRLALRTDSGSEARRKAAAVEAAKLAEWNALAAGDTGAARQAAERARIAAAQPQALLPAQLVSAAEIHEMMEMLRALMAAQLQGAPGVAAAPARQPCGAAWPTLRAVWRDHAEATRVARLRKTPAQEKRWRQARELALRNFLSVIGGDRTVDRIGRAEARQFRDWLAARVAAKRYGHSAANKQIAALSVIWREWSERTGAALANPFRGLHLPGGQPGRRPPFSRDWVRGRLLAAGALDGLNDEARDVLLVMVNTGLGPSEIVDAAPADWRLEAPIPHLDVTGGARELKVAHRARAIPLLGVSLAAARRIAARGGCARYAGRATHWSNCVNKYLRANGLAETDRHTAYSLRHYVEDALLDAGVDERLRVDILGHKYNRPRYGHGGGLKARRDALEKIAL